ncbi:chitobiase/beta-hexosaminidase C-terminal domain-containing protein [Paenibacillus psychroresistens]|nr:chitobiase/beta-hexosaminidase C-terminal domain-containing protein [Paenibacillus psychroresistens]
MKFNRNLSAIVIATFLLTLISTGIATPALGKSSRIAIISDLTGSATVKSSGGSREYDAYIDMGLAQGDYITTDANSSVTFKIKDHEDEVTIGSNAVVSLTTLTDKGKGKKSKIKVLSGSVWSNVKKLSGGDDFEVETPTAVMAVRGTKVLTNVDSETGETYVAVAAGTVSAKTNSEDATEDEGKEILIAPSQQLSLDSRDEVTDLEDKVAIIDPEKLVSETPSEIIEAIIKDKADIDRENAEFIAAQKEKIANGDPTGIARDGAGSSLDTKDQSELDKVAKNLDNLIGNVAKTAIEEKKVDKEKIDKIIEELNKDITDPTKKLDLDKVLPMDKTAGVDPELQKKKDEELKKLEAAKKAADEVKKAAEDAAKLKLAEALKKLDAEKARIAKEKEDLGLNKPTPTPSPIPVPSPSSSPAPTTRQTVATPSFDIPAGTYTSPQSVHFTSATEGVTYYYTTDKTTPTTSSTPGAFVTIDKISTLKVIATKPGYNDSAVASRDYTIAVAAPSFDHGSGAVSSGTPVTITTVTAGAVIRYTTNNTKPTSTSTIFNSSSPIQITSDTTIRAIAFKANLADSSEITVAYTLSVLQTAEKPTFLPGEGTFTTTKTIELFSATQDATIYYTTDGSEPVINGSGVVSTDSITHAYTIPINVSVTTTIKAIAVKPGMLKSGTATGLFTINLPLPAVTVTPTINQFGSNNFDLVLTINNLIAANQVAGVEVHVVSPGNVNLTALQSGISSAFFGESSVKRFNNAVSREVIFAAVLPTMDPDANITGPYELVKLPFSIFASTENTTQYPLTIYIKVVNTDGTSYTFQNFNFGTDIIDTPATIPVTYFNPVILTEQ